MKFVLLAFLALLSFTLCYPQNITNLEIEGKGYFLNGKKILKHKSFTEFEQFDTSYNTIFICNDTLVREPTFQNGIFQQSIQIRDRLYIYNSQE
nr:hypothetical protein [Saprospiraceae bacterium]